MSWVIAFAIGITVLVGVSALIHGSIRLTIYLSRFRFWQVIGSVFEFLIILFGITTLVGTSAMIVHKLMYGTP